MWKTVVLFSLLLCSSMAWAQSTAQISGTVTDQKRCCVAGSGDHGNGDANRVDSFGGEWITSASGTDARSALLKPKLGHPEMVRRSLPRRHRRRRRQRRPHRLLPLRPGHMHNRG